MYQIDINFLNDRAEYSPVGDSGSVYAGQVESNTPLILGGAFGLGLVGLVLLAFAGTAFYNGQLSSKERALQADLDKLAPQIQEVEALQQQERQVKAETQALATIFNQIKPWSAMLQDIRDRVPPTLQITKITQTSPAPPSTEQSANAGETNAAETAPAPTPPSINSDLSLSGNALAFSDVNDFELTLRKSPFLTSDSTKLMKSERNTNQQTGISLVEYEMSSEVNSVPAAELTQVLNAKGASGLVARIDALKQQGVMPR